MDLLGKLKLPELLSVNREKELKEVGSKNCDSDSGKSSDEDCNYDHENIDIDEPNRNRTGTTDRQENTQNNCENRIGFYSANESPLCTNKLNHNQQNNYQNNRRTNQPTVFGSSNKENNTLAKNTPGQNSPCNTVAGTPTTPTLTVTPPSKEESSDNRHQDSIPNSNCWKSAGYWINSTLHKNDPPIVDKSSMIQQPNLLTGDVHANADNTPASWNRFLHCFSAFKPKKISSSTNENSSPPGDQLNLPSLPKIKRNMTESDFFLYELASKSAILDHHDTKNLGVHLPPRAIGYSWDLIYNTTTDGFSLHSIYRKMEDVDHPVLLVIQDIHQRVFGAMLSCGMRISEHFYGTSDTFLFRCRPEFDVFKWQGDNFYFIQGQDRFFSLGSDNGKFGLWLDDNLYLGRTDSCSTFNSPALVPEKDFKIKTVECWQAVM